MENGQHIIYDLSHFFNTNESPLTKTKGHSRLRVNEIVSRMMNYTMRAWESLGEIGRILLLKRKA